MIRSERGSTLIVVLMVLLLIMIVGTLAIRQSISSLKLVTNNQIQTLLLQSSDAALLALQNPNNTPDIAAANGIVGFFKNENHKEAELVFCFSESSPFTLSKGAYLLNSPNWESLGGGACTKDSKSAGRKQVVTQVYIKRATTPTTPFADLARGTEVLGAKTEESIRLQVFVVSVMQGLLSDTDKILFKKSTAADEGCLVKSIDNAGKNEVAECLKQNKENPLYNMQVAEYRFLSDFEPSGS
ncbi:PilX N-terminal domain-containing pilus assembly protein [Acinetobacter haemolyticus]|uniref:PilX N-terminal domain-containing pilus assembly protein n=1 Tax=Acinetobacter haemolyticus TaxID=29430 RepID=UPI00325B05C1